MRTYLTLLLAWCSLTATASFAQADQILLNPPAQAQPKLDLKAAIDALKQGNVAKCRMLLREEVEKHADASDPEVILAGLLIEADEVPAAKQVLTDLLLATDTAYEAHLALARVAAMEKRWADAWAHIRITEIEVGPTRWSREYSQAVQDSVRNLKATIALARRDWLVAQPLLEEISREEPGNFTALRSLGELYFQQGKTGRSREVFENAAALDSEDRIPYQVRLARLHIANDQPEPAEKLLQMAIRTDGVGGQLACLAYAEWLINGNRAKEAESLLSPVDWEDSLQTQRSVLLGMACRMQHDFEKAEEVFTRLHQSDSTNVTYSNQLALVLIESSDEGKRARALQIANSNVGRVQSESTISTLAWVQYRLGDIRAAADLFVRLSNSTQLSPDSAFYFSEILRAGGRTEEAKQLRRLAQNASGPRFAKLP